MSVMHCCRAVVTSTAASLVASLLTIGRVGAMEIVDPKER
jgi:hypothetical protein